MMKARPPPLPLSLGIFCFNDVKTLGGGVSF